MLPSFLPQICRNLERRKIPTWCFSSFSQCSLSFTRVNWRYTQSLEKENLEIREALEMRYHELYVSGFKLKVSHDWAIFATSFQKYITFLLYIAFIFPNFINKTYFTYRMYKNFLKWQMMHYKLSIITCNTYSCIWRCISRYRITEITLFIKIKHLKIILHIFMSKMYNRLQDH